MDAGAEETWTALVRPPTEDLASGERTHVPRLPIDFALALEQHRAYAGALRALGLRVVQLDPLPGHPDAAFVEDAAVVLDEIAVLPRMGARSRRGESDSVRSALAPYRSLIELPEPATLDGGDVLALDGVLYVGQTARTNHAGLKALAHAVLEHGYAVKAVEVQGCLHLKSACADLGGGRVLANPRWIRMERMRGLEVVEVDAREPAAASVLSVGGRVLVPRSAPRTAERLERLGHRLLPLDLSELEKAEGGLTCLSLRFRRAPTRAAR